MLLPFLFYTTLLSLCLGQLKLDTNKCDDQACYIPKSCMTDGSETDLKRLSAFDHTINTSKCAFWFTLNPFSFEKVLIRVLSKDDFEVSFMNGDSFFSCQNKNGNIITGVGTKYESVKSITYKDGDRLYCELLLKKKSGVPQMILTPKDSLDMMQFASKKSYIYQQAQMALDFGNKIRCDPDKISPLPDNYMEAGYYYMDASTEYRDVTCPSNYKLMFVIGPKGAGGKAETLTSLKCIGSPGNYKYKREPAGKGNGIIDSGASFNLSCQTENILCKMCTDPGVSATCTLNSPEKCPKYKEGTKDTECNTFECPKFLTTNSGTVKKGAQCTPTSPGKFEWKVVKHGTNETQSITKTECLTEVECSELYLLPSDPTCDPIGCPPDSPQTCSADFNMTFYDGKNTEKIDSISCDKSSGDWKSNNNKIIPPGSTFNCTPKVSTSGEEGNEGNASLRTGGTSQIDWLLIGGIALAGMLILIIGAIVLYCMFFRPEKKPASVVRSAPPTAPTSQPISNDKTPSLQQPSSGSNPTSQPMTPPVVSLPREPVKVVLVVKHEEVKKEKSKMETINIKQNIPDEKTEPANSQTGENLSNKTAENSKAETKEQSKTAGTTKEQKTNTQSEAQKKSEVNHTKTEEDSKSFIDAYNKELDKKLGKKK